jgi:hypothetical protein
MALLPWWFRKLLTRPVHPFVHLVGKILRFVAHIARRVTYTICGIINTLAEALRWAFRLTSG